MEFTKPSLTEFTTKYYIRHSLKEVRVLKDKYMTIGVNILLLTIFITLIGGLLYYKYKGKLTDQEKKWSKNNKKKCIYFKNYIKFHMRKIKRNKI